MAGSKRTVLFFLAAVLLIVCGTKKTVSDYLEGNPHVVNYTVENLGQVQYTAKSLGGLFYKHENKLCLICGTEVSDGGYAQVFVYSVAENKMLFNRIIDPAVCIMAFCEAGDKIFFATISRNLPDGCDLYYYDKVNNDIAKVYHFDDKGIYAMVWDCADTLFIATTWEARLYQYSLTRQEVECVLENFTDGVYIRSMSYSDGIVYLGIGSNADLIAFDTKQKKWKSILPETLKNNTFVYSQAIDHGRLYYLAKYDSAIYMMQLKNDNEYACSKVADYQQTVMMKKGGTWIDIEGDILFLDDAGNVSEQHTFQGIRSYYDADSKYFYSLDTSIVLSRYKDETCISKEDLSERLEKSWIIPLEFLAYNNTLYFPGRRFVVWDRDNDLKKIFLVKDEPQAAAVGKFGVFTGNYPLCTVYAYDFSVFKEKPNEVSLSNEDFLIADIDAQCRPQEMDLTSDERYLVLGSGPMYGQFGGAVSVWNVSSKTLLYSIKDVVEQQTIRTVKCSNSVRNAVWLGTMPYGENTNPSCLEIPAHMILWDIPNQSILIDIVVNDDIRKIISIAESANTVYCTTENCEVFAFDINSGEKVGENNNDEILYLLTTKDGGLMGMSTSRGSVYLLDKRTLEGTVVADGFHNLKNLRQDPITGDIYFFDNTELMKMTRLNNEKR